MVTIAFRYIGDRAWRIGSLPMTLQAAVGDARSLAHQKRFADEVKVMPASPSPRLVDVRI